MNGMVTGTRSDGMKVVNKPMTISQTQFHWEVLISVQAVNPKRLECVKMNLVSRAAVNTCPLNFGPDGAGNGRFFRTASGECILDVEPGSFQGYDENDLCRSLNGRLTGVQKHLSTSSTISLSTEVKSKEPNTVKNSQQPGNELAGPRPRESNEISELGFGFNW